MLKAGKLNALVTLSRKSGGGWGEPAGQVQYAAAWAHIKHLSGMSSIKADKVASTVQASIRLRWRSDVKAGDLVKHGAQTYTVRAVMPSVETKEMIDLVCDQTA